MTQAPTPGPLTSMPTVDLTDDMLFKIETGETVAWGEIKRRLAPTAPVEASGSEREHGPKCWGGTSFSDEMAHCYCGSTDLRPQPSGETRKLLERAAAIADDVERGKRPKLEAVDMIRELRNALLSARPLALGGQQGEFSVEEYVADYEFRADGEGGCYTPTENERALLIDAIHGALSEFSLSTTPARAEAQDEQPDITPYTEDLKGLKTAMQAKAQDEGAARDARAMCVSLAASLEQIANGTEDDGFAWAKAIAQEAIGQ